MSAKPLEYNATITHKQLMTSTLGIFRVKADKSWTPFIPGQYAILGLNHPEKGGVMRAYSIASAPYLHKDYLEFYVRFVNEPTSENPMTHLLFEAKEGDRIYTREKLQGHFTEEKAIGLDDPRLKVFVASGTGLAPFTSIVFEHHNKTKEAGNYVILHGASYPVDLGYGSELEEIMNKQGVKRYIGTISRPKEAPGWVGLTGRVENHFAPDMLPALERELGLPEGGFNPKNVVVMICGLQGTIANTLMSLLHRGFVPGDRKLRRVLGVQEEMPASLHFEQYDTIPIIDIKDEALVAELTARLKEGLAKYGDGVAAG
ncbi:hypothetical protein BH09SUM1_BH09SUM1_16110 [soil metagenome]